MSFKIFLILSSGGPCARWSSTIYAILEEDIIGNLYVNNFKFGLVVQEEILFKEKDYRRKDARHTKTNQNSSP